MRAWAVPLLLLTAGLAGCIGGQDAADDGLDDPNGQATGADTAQGPAEDLLAPVVFDATEPSQEVRWENGTFDITEHSHPKGIATGVVGEYDPDRREIDLTPMVPTGVPAVLTAEINAELGQGDVDLWIDAPDEEIWASDYDAPYGGYTSLAVTIIHTSSEPITLNVRYDEIDDSTGFDYTLRYAAHVDPGLLPAGVPVGVEVPEEATGLRVDFEDEAEGRAVAFWGPDDSFIGRFEPDQRFTLPVDEIGAPGEYVVMLPEGSAPARISLVGLTEAPDRLRPLTQDIQFGTPQQASGGETELSWSFQADRVPLQAGLFWEGSEVSQDTQASLASPTAHLIGLDIDGGPWLGAGFGTITDMGVAGLTTGTYEAQVSFGETLGSSGMTANHVLVFYDRGR